MAQFANDAAGESQPIAGTNSLDTADRGISGGVVLLLVALAFGALFQGAFYRGPFAVFGLLVAASAAYTAFDRKRRGAARYPGHPGPVTGIRLLCGLLVATTAVSAVGNHRIGESITTVVALIVMLLSTVTVHGASAASRRRLVQGIVAVGVGVAVTGIVGVVGHIKPLAIVDGGLWRAASTLTYANAAAAFLGLVLPVAVAVADQKRFTGVFDRLAVVVVVCGLLLTGSRAGVGAALLGLVAFGVIGGVRLVRAAAPSLVAGGMLAVGAVVSMPTARSDALPLRVGAFLLGAAFAFAIVGRRPHADPRRSRHPGSGDGRASGRSRATLAMIGISALVTIAIGAAIASDSALRSRFSLDSPSRSQEWQAAVDHIVASPVLGAGPGPMTFVLHGKTTRTVSFAHNEYLQLTVQQGMVGLVGLVLGLAAVAWSVRRSRRTWSVFDAAAFVGCCVVALHAAFDYVFHVPVILAGVVILLTLSTSPADTDRHEPQLLEHQPFP